MITIPKKHYVGFQTRSDGLLGFATPYEENSAFEKRKSTVDRWSDDTIDKQILTNELLAGFEVAQEVRRSGWSHGNVVWRIVDPRGFQLEISSGNFAQIIDCTTVTNGVIQGRCIWGRDGGDNVLLPEQSEPYRLATENTERASTSVSAKELTPGDIVLMKEGGHLTFLGNFHIAELTNKDRRQGYGYNKDRITDYTYGTKKRYFFTDGTKFFASSGITNVSRIITKTTNVLDANATAAQINTFLGSQAIDSLDDVIYVSPQPIKQFTPVLVKQDDYTVHLTHKRGWRCGLWFVKQDGHPIKKAYISTGYNFGNHEDTVYCYDVDQTEVETGNFSSSNEPHSQYHNAQPLSNHKNSVWYWLHLQVEDTVYPIFSY